MATESKLMGDAGRQWVEHELTINRPQDDYTKSLITDMVFRAFISGWACAMKTHGIPVNKPWSPNE